MRIWSTGRSLSLWIPVEGFVIAPGNSAAALGEAIPVIWIGFRWLAPPTHAPTIVRYIYLGRTNLTHRHYSPIGPEGFRT